MKYKHFDDIKPNNKTDFIMLYFAACRSLRELEAAIRKTNIRHNVIKWRPNCHISPFLHFLSVSVITGISSSFGFDFLKSPRTRRSISKDGKNAIFTLLIPVNCISNTVKYYNSASILRIMVSYIKTPQFCGIFHALTLV